MAPIVCYVLWCPVGGAKLLNSFHSSIKGSERLLSIIALSPSLHNFQAARNAVNTLCDLDTSQAVYTEDGKMKDREGGNNYKCQRSQCPRRFSETRFISEPKPDLLHTACKNARVIGHIVCPGFLKVQK